MSEVATIAMVSFKDRSTLATELRYLIERMEHYDETVSVEQIKCLAQLVIGEGTTPGTIKDNKRLREIIDCAMSELERA